MASRSTKLLMLFLFSNDTSLFVALHARAKNIEMPILPFMLPLVPNTTARVQKVIIPLEKTLKA